MDNFVAMQIQIYSILNQISLCNVCESLCSYVYKIGPRKNMKKHL